MLTLFKLARMVPVGSFAVRDFRLLWAADALGSWAEYIELIVLSWLVLVITDSPFMLGVFGALRFIGTLSAPIHGMMADQYDRAKLFTGFRITLAIITGAVLALAIIGQLTVWYIFFLMILGGITRSGNIVTRDSLVADKLTSDELMNGVALNRIAWYAAQLAGPLVGGILLSKFGVIWAFTPVVILNCASSFLAYLIRPSIQILPKSSKPALNNLTDAFRYITTNQIVLALLLIAFLVNFTVIPMSHGLMPLFARDVLDVGPTGLAVLLSAYAASALVGSLTLVTLNGMKRPGRFLVVATLVWHLGLLMFAWSQWFKVSFAILLATGVAQAFSLVTMATLLLKTISPEMRGRVMGARALAVYALPLGLITAGLLADSFGAPFTLAIFSLSGAIFTTLIAIRFRKLWNVK